MRDWPNARRFLAAALTLGLLSLMGLPPLAGFIAKFYVFSQAAQHGLIWLVIIAVINSVISAYYYLRIVKTIWMDEPDRGARSFFFLRS